MDDFVRFGVTVLKFFRKLRNGRIVTEVTNVTSTIVPKPTLNASGDGFLYKVTLPNQEPVMLRAKNKVEVKKLVRGAQGLTKLPAGTVVERIENGDN